MRCPHPRHGPTVLAAALLLVASACSNEAHPSAQSTTSTTSTTTVEPSTTGPAPVTACASGQVSVRVGRNLPSAAPVTGQPRLELVITNDGDSACTIEGFPVVEIIGQTAHGDETQPVVDSGPATPDMVHLAPGGHGYSVLTTLAADGSPPDALITPEHLRVTLPGSRTPAVLPWTGPESIQNNDAATHPGTYIGPITAVPPS